MPELPDVEVYRERLTALIVGQPLDRITIAKPFVLRTVDPPVSTLDGRHVAGVERLGKRLLVLFEGGPVLVIHLMIAGRLRWRPATAGGGAKPDSRGATRGRRAGSGLSPRLILAWLSFPNGTLYLTEAGTTRRASIHVLASRADLAEFDRGGLEILDTDLAGFAARLTSEGHTVKRALTDPRLFSGVGNAYSDEILHRARLSPFALTRRISGQEIERLYDASRAVLTEWTARLREEVGDGFPETVTAFRPGMAVHGRYKQPCPVCGAPVQRIRYASNETNYCARCQTEGRLLADRALSRLLREDWPRSIDEVSD
jgi:formamidopyrimidine-DNA glycosylase